METNYHTAVVGLICLFSPFLFFAQSGPEFLNCPDSPLSLCVQDEGVRIPASNKLNLGDLNPLATSCSVHVSRSVRVKGECGHTLDYEVLYFANDVSPVVVLQSVKTVELDSLGEAELNFDTESSLDSTLRYAGLPYTTGCNDAHRIKFVARDSCGNTSVCDLMLDLYDCAAPQIMPLHPVTILTSSIVGYVTLNASSFFLSVTDDCAERLSFLYSLKEDYYLPDTVIYLCDIPNWNVQVPLDIWIADKGRDLNCDGTISWEERNQFLTSPKVVYLGNGSIDCFYIDYFLSGNVLTEYGDPVSNVKIEAQANSGFYPSYTTGMDGSYFFAIPLPEEIKLYASRNDNHRNGVSTLDVIKIQKHLLGIELLPTPYRLIAADANNSASVNALDLIEMRKLVLGLYPEFPNNTSWRFIPKSCNLDSLNPFGACNEYIVDLSGNPYSDNNNFIGVKIGDLNNTAIPNFQSIETRSALPMVDVIADDMTYKAGQVIEFNLMIPEAEALAGFQFTLSDQDLLFTGLQSPDIDISDEAYGLFGDTMTVAWLDEKFDPVRKPSQGIQLVVHAVAKRNGRLSHGLKLSSSMTDAECYTYDEKVSALVLTFPSQQNQPFSIVDLSPNPWAGTARLSYTVSTNEPVTMQVYNTSGQLEWTTEEIPDPGLNTTILQRRSLQSTGMKVLVVTQDGNVSTRRMLIAD